MFTIFEQFMLTLGNGWILLATELYQFEAISRRNYACGIDIPALFFLYSVGKI